MIIPYLDSSIERIEAKKENLYVVHRKGRSSEELSRKIEDISLINSSITFIIGGSLGLNENLLNNCQEKLCFSKMTFPHQLIRVFLLEQIFRGFKISNNETYHR